MQATANCMPEWALKCGHDADGDDIYVGRTECNGELLPAKIVPNKGDAYIPTNHEKVKLE